MGSRIRSGFAVLTMVGVALSAGALASAAKAPVGGTLDKTFSRDGMLRVSTANYTDARDVAVTPDEKVVVLLLREDPGISLSAQVVRYLPNGKLDKSFSGDGIATLNQGTSIEFPRAVDVQDDGKVIVAGATISGNFTVVRLNANGTQDTDYGTGGVQTVDFGTANDVAQGLVIDDDGEAVIGGVSQDNLAFTRLEMNGDIDTTFGDQGKRTVDVGSSAGVSRLRIDGTGRPVAVGGANGQGFIVRLGADGDPDTSFAGDGSYSTSLDGSVRLDDVAFTVTSEPIAAGVVSGDGGADFLALRLDGSGVLDPAFSSDGVATVDFRNSDLASSIVRQPNGRVILAGSDGRDAALARINKNGTIHREFGKKGRVTTDFAKPRGSLDRINALALSPRHRVVAVGTVGSTVEPGGAFVARYRRGPGE